MSRLYDIGRYEFKYALPLSLRARILAHIDDAVMPDPHALPLPNGGMGYEVHSLYFDTPDLRDYWERLDERKVRNRLRVRTYGRPGTKQPVFVENKRKLEHWVVKSRTSICHADDWCASSSPWPWREWVERVRGGKRYAAIHFQRLMEDFDRKPVSVVHYEREVFVARDVDQPKVRLTIDRNVCATVSPTVTGLYAPPDVDLLPPDWMVLELKFDLQRPAFMRRICRDLGLRASPVSKFGLSVAKGVRGNQPREVRYLTPLPLRRLGWGL